MELLMMLLRASWRVFIVAIHLIFIVVASYLAFWLRYDGMIPDWALALFAKWLPVLIAMRGLALVPFGVFDGIWRLVLDALEVALDVAGARPRALGQAAEQECRRPVDP